MDRLPFLPCGKMVATPGLLVNIRAMEHLRNGQVAFNELYAIDPGLADLIRGTEADPFYDDSRLAVFQETVSRLRAERSEF